MSEQLHRCPECDGRGEVPTLEWVESIAVGYGGVPCKNCDGTGWLDEHGEPLTLEPEEDHANK